MGILDFFKKFQEWDRKRVEKLNVERETRKRQQEELDWERRKERARAVGRMEAGKIHRENEQRRKSREKILREGIFGFGRK